MDKEVRYEIRDTRDVTVPSGSKKKPKTEATITSKQYLLLKKLVRIAAGVLSRTGWHFHVKRMTKMALNALLFFLLYSQLALVRV